MQQDRQQVTIPRAGDKPQNPNQRTSKHKVQHNATKPSISHLLTSAVKPGQCHNEPSPPSKVEALLPAVLPSPSYPVNSGVQSYTKTQTNMKCNERECFFLTYTHTHTHTVEQGNVHVTGRTQQSCTSYCPFLYSRLKHTQRSTAFSHCSRAAHPMPATELPGCVWCPEMEPNTQLLPQQWEPQGRNLTLISFQRGFSFQSLNTI